MVWDCNLNWDYSNRLLCNIIDEPENVSLRYHLMVRLRNFEAILLKVGDCEYAVRCTIKEKGLRVRYTKDRKSVV